ncbi:MAG: lipopolysaccharide core heptose(I) kinase RfaP [Gammaproteobacteria bacterium]
MRLIIFKPYRSYFALERSLTDYFAITGETARRVYNRHILRFERGGRWFFIKRHSGVGWREIIKNVMRLRRPVVDALPEWRAIQRLHELGVATLEPVGCGVEGINPAQRRSFLITADLGATVSLEQLTQGWRQQPPGVRQKRALIRRLAAIAKRLHENGVNHRDFYLCHFLLGHPSGADGSDWERLPLYVIDLHRAQIRRRTPERWIVKDVGSLYFSALDCGLSRRDLLCFIQAYGGKPLRAALGDRAVFWRKVQRRAVRLYRREWRKEPLLVLGH